MKKRPELLELKSFYLWKSCNACLVQLPYEASPVGGPQSICRHPVRGPPVQRPHGRTLKSCDTYFVSLHLDMEHVCMEYYFALYFIL